MCNMTANIPLREFIYDKQGNVVNVLPYGISSDTAARMVGMGPVAVSAKIAEALVGVPFNIPTAVLNAMQENAEQGQTTLRLQTPMATSSGPVIVNAPMTAALGSALGYGGPRMIANPRHVNNLPKLNLYSGEEKRIYKVPWLVTSASAFGVDSSASLSGENADSDISGGISAITMASPMYDARQRNTTIGNSPHRLTPTLYIAGLPGSIDLRGEPSTEATRIVTNSRNMSQLADSVVDNDVGAITMSSADAPAPTSNGSTTRLFRRIHRR